MTGTTGTGNTRRSTLAVQSGILLRRDSKIRVQHLYMIRNQIVRCAIALHWFVHNRGVWSPALGAAEGCARAWASSTSKNLRQAPITAFAAPATGRDRSCSGTDHSNQYLFHTNPPRETKLDAISE